MMDLLTHYWPLLIAGILLVLSVVEFRRYQQAKRHFQAQAENEPSIPDAQMVLLRVNSNISVRDRNIIVAMMILFLLVFLLIPAFVVSNKQPGGSLSELFALYLDFISKKPGKFIEVVVVCVFIPLLLVYFQQVMSKERLVLDKNGITYHPPDGWLFRLFSPAWHLKWVEIASLKINNYLARGQLVITPRFGRSRYLLVPVWQQPDQADVNNKSILMRIRRQHAIQTDPVAMLDLPLLRYIREVAGIDIHLKDTGPLGFDLMKNIHTRSGVLLLFTIIFYSLFDYLFLNERYVLIPSLWWFIFGGVLVTIVAGVWFRNNEVPQSSAWGLAVLLGVIAGIGLYPGLLRINQLTDSEGLQHYEYRHVEPRRFVPLLDDLPVITMDSSEYWRNVTYDEPVVFYLRRGALGFYQIDMGKEYRKMRMWYCVKRAGGNAEKLKACDGV